MREFRRAAAVVGLLGIALGAPASMGGAPAPDFRRDIAPVLQKRCVACHSAARREAGLRLDGPGFLRRGGDSGPAVVPGRSGESLLVRLVTAVGERRMPPAGPRLPAGDVQRLRQWIDAGAKGGEDAAESHWAFRVPVQVSIPAPNGRGDLHPVDAFIEQRLQRDRLAPNPPAGRPALLRRLSLDLLGLLPEPGELERYVADSSPSADEALVDRLLASPHFGERWGRHWLDLARYADSDGYEKDLPRPTAYVYRDWVIDAVNRDLPYDVFTRDQLAGDLVPGAGTREKIATGFHRNTLKNREGGIDPEEDRVKCNVDRVSTTGTIWLGLTVACGECHSHKYDPLTQREFYGLYAFFNAAMEADVPLAAGEPSAKPPAGKPAEPPKAMILVENPSPPATYLHIRGDFLRKGEAVTAGVPAFLHPMKIPAGVPEARRPNRLDLAAWLTAPENPLTARVAVNRVWQHLFGRGLVATPDDFGTRGERPSHPALLDWLAVHYSKPADQGGLGWSLKKLIRFLVTSQAYRRSSADRPDLRRRDPRNVLLARQSRFRPEAEIVRDLHLSAGGLLHRAVGGPSVRPPLPADIAALGYANSVKWAESPAPERYRRGMYIFYQRTVPYPMLSTFDAPDANNACTRRERSNTPLQALTLLNDPVFHEAAQALGRRVMKERQGTGERLRHAFRLCLTREPGSDEVARLLALQSRSARDFEADPKRAAQFSGGRAGEPDAAEAASWVVVARVLMNLDEFLTRE